MHRGKFGTNMGSFFAGKRVAITGHTGFKGSWLSHVLNHFGARVYGFALPADPRSHFVAAETEQAVNHTIGDIRDEQALDEWLQMAAPEILIHMAAQPIVRESYDDPIYTMQTNVMGTANLLQRARSCTDLKTIAVITSDKCYENKERQAGYAEHEAMGGHDPYSASKGAAELVSASFARSFFINENKSLLTLRGGNVIGGGDWSKDRIMTDIVQALQANEAPLLRNPNAIRPWQHILDVLAGYLSAISHIGASANSRFDSFNIGPLADNEANVQTLAEAACLYWGTDIEPILKSQKDAPHEANILRLDITKASKLLDWSPKYDLAQTVEKTVEWYLAYNRGDVMTEFSNFQIRSYFGE